MKKLLFFFAVSFLPLVASADWQPPTNMPPFCPQNQNVHGCDAPVNTSNTLQGKGGQLVVGWPAGSTFTDTKPFGLATPQHVVGTSFCFFDPNVPSGINCIGRNWKTGGDPLTGTFVNSIRSGSPATITVNGTGPNGTGDVIITGTGGGAGGLSGSGTTNKLAKWVGSLNPSQTLADSLITDNGTAVTIGGDVTANAFCLPNGQCVRNTWGDILNFFGPTDWTTVNNHITPQVVITDIGLCPSGQVLRGGNADGTKNCVPVSGGNNNFWALNSATGDINSSNPGSVRVNNHITSFGMDKKGFCLDAQCVSAWGDAVNYFTDQNFKYLFSHVGSCADGSVLKGMNTDGTPNCVPAGGGGSGGTVRRLDAGPGIIFSDNPIVTTGIISANPSYIRTTVTSQVGVCPDKNILKGINPDGTPNCVPDSGSPGAKGADGAPAPLAIPVYNNPGAMPGAVNGSIWLCMSNCQ